MFDLVPADLRHECEVVVSSALLVAAAPPSTDPAMVHGVRVGVRIPGDRLIEETSHHAVVGGVVRELIALNYSIAQDQMEIPGIQPLDPGHLVRVVAQLQNRRSLWAAGEFGVEHLVAEVAEVAWTWDLPEKVRVAAPMTVKEHRLVDEVGSISHRLLGLSRAINQRFRGSVRWGINRDDGETCAFQTLFELLFMLQALLSEEINQRVVPNGSRHEPSRGSFLKLSQVFAGKEPGEVAGAVDKRPI